MDAKSDVNALDAAVWRKDRGRGGRRGEGRGGGGRGRKGGFTVCLCMSYYVSCGIETWGCLRVCVCLLASPSGKRCGFAVGFLCGFETSPSWPMSSAPPPQMAVTEIAQRRSLSNHSTAMRGSD